MTDRNDGEVMIERDEIDVEADADRKAAADLGGYIESLPEGSRSARDRPARRQRLLPSLRAHVAREIRRVRRRRGLARAAGVALIGGAGAAAALWLGLSPWKASPRDARASAALVVLDGALLLEAGGVARTLHAGESVGLADVGTLEASSDLPVRVRLSDVVALTLAPSSRVRPIATGGGRADGAAALEVVALERGRVHLEVKKLGDARRFHVVTPDADVEVRGTSFDVALRAGASLQTCVTVQEGLVLVAGGLRSRLLARGESWGCDEVGAGLPATAVDGPAATHGLSKTDPPKAEASPRSPLARAGATRAHIGDGLGASDLGAQNRLFQTALAAERAGHVDVAARIYRQLLARAPRGPLAAQARANLTALSGAAR